MKPGEDATIVTVPKESTIIGDDRYLVEMTERLQRLRSLLGEQKARKSKRRKAGTKRTFNSMM